MTTATTAARLLNPATYEAGEFDPATQRLLRATIDWFEAKGKARADRRDAHATSGTRTSSSSSRASARSRRC